VNASKEDSQQQEEGRAAFHVKQHDDCCVESANDDALEGEESARS